MISIESADSCGGVQTALNSYPDLDLPRHNGIQGYVTPHPPVPAWLLRPGIVLIEVLATNVAALGTFASLAPGSFLFLPTQRLVALAVNLALAVGFFLLFIASHRAGRHAAHLRQAAKAGLAMALLTGPVLYISIGRNAFGPIFLLVLALSAAVRGLMDAYRQREIALLDAGGEAPYPPLLQDGL